MKQISKTWLGQKINKRIQMKVTKKKIKTRLKNNMLENILETFNILPCIKVHPTLHMNSQSCNNYCEGNNET
jgi:hypothetical protein